MHAHLGFRALRFRALGLRFQGFRLLGFRAIGFGWILGVGVRAQGIPSEGLPDILGLSAQRISFRGLWVWRLMAYASTETESFWQCGL